MFAWFKTTSNAEKIKTLGQIGEEFAQVEYKNRGYKIIAANFFNRKGLRLGEVDFIATNGHEIIFVEVKTRNSQVSKYGSGEEAVNQFKQLKILKAVKVFLQKYPKYIDLRPQIDVCVVLYNELDNPAFCAKIISNAVEDWN